jgi:proteic killer suppression protein
VSVYDCKIQAQREKRLKSILSLLDTAQVPEDMNIMGLRLHPLKGSYDGFYAVSVTGDWRVVFRFENNQPTDVDLVDYH